MELLLANVKLISSDGNASRIAQLRRGEKIPVQLHLEEGVGIHERKSQNRGPAFKCCCCHVGQRKEMVILSHSIFLHIYSTLKLQRLILNFSNFLCFGFFFLFSKGKMEHYNAHLEYINQITCRTTVGLTIDQFCRSSKHWLSVY